MCAKWTSDLGTWGYGRSLKSVIQSNVHTFRSCSINFSSSSLCLVMGSAESVASTEDGRRGEARPRKTVIYKMWQGNAQWKGKYLGLPNQFLCECINILWVDFSKEILLCKFTNINNNRGKLQNIYYLFGLNT